MNIDMQSQIAKLLTIKQQGCTREYRKWQGYIKLFTAIASIGKIARLFPAAYSDRQ